MDALEKAKIIAKAIDDKKAHDVEVLCVEKQTSLCEYFVMGACQSNTQVKACADNAEEKMKESGETVHHIEGYAGGSWILLDYGDVVVHVMTDETKNFYDLGRLWEDAESVSVDFKKIGYTTLK